MKMKFIYILFVFALVLSCRTVKVKNSNWKEVALEEFKIDSIGSQIAVDSNGFGVYLVYKKNKKLRLINLKDELILTNKNQKIVKIIKSSNLNDSIKQIVINLYTWDSNF